MTIELIGEWPAELQVAIGQMLEALDAETAIELPEGRAINLKLVDDAEIAALNEQYSGNAYATDVLTFAYDEDEAEEAADPEDEQPETLADIVMSTETAAKQAKQAGITLPDEVALLALHGILHALGYDHQDEQAQQKVETLQSQILTRAGIPYREFTWEQ